MEQVGLAALAARYPDLGQEEDWSRVLSGGEQQRLGFARLLLRRPALVILDEASSAMDLQAEEALYGLLVAAGPTVVSVGHRPSLRAFHHWELALEGGGAGGSPRSCRRPDRLVRIGSRGSWNRWNAAEPSRPTPTPESKPPPPRLLRCPSPNPLTSSPSSSGSSEISREFWRWC